MLLLRHRAVFKNRKTESQFKVNVHTHMSLLSHTFTRIMHVDIAGNLKKEWTCTSSSNTNTREMLIFRIKKKERFEKDEFEEQMEGRMVPPLCVCVCVYVIM